MAHIPDGILATPVLALGAAVTAAGVAVALKRLDHERIPQVGVLAAGFFVVSMVYVPVGPSSVHFMLTGLMGIMLGWAAFPAILVALALQAVLFGFGGLTSLGVNVMNLAAPAVLAYYLCRAVPKIGWAANPFLRGAFAGSGAVLISLVMIAASLAVSGQGFVTAAKVMVFAYLPLALVEGLLTGAATALLSRVRPEFMDGAVPFRPRGVVRA